MLAEGELHAIAAAKKATSLAPSFAFVHTQGSFRVAFI